MGEGLFIQKSIKQTYYLKTATSTISIICCRVASFDTVLLCKPTFTSMYFNIFFTTLEST